MKPDAYGFQFDRMENILKIKRSLGADKIIGFEKLSDPRNRSANFLALGQPSTESELPLLKLSRSG